MSASVTETDCSACYGWEIENGRLVCGEGHEFPIRNGVARLCLKAELTPASSSTASGSEDHQDGLAIGASFSREWSHFKYDNRTWAMEVEQRCSLFLKELACDAEDLWGKVVLDAGCGNGSLSRAINRFGCEVVAADMSSSVERAYRHFADEGNDRTHFVQADLTRHPFRPEAFDVIYSSGVLHHNPNTRAALTSVVWALKPGGYIYIWVYHKVPGLRHVAKQLLRACLAPLPGAMKHALVCLWLPQAMVRQYARTFLGRNTPEDRLSWRERLVLLLDHYTPRYRWEHTQDEVKGWYRELGLTDIVTTEVRDWGFGVVGRKPIEPVATGG
ncbi:MAG: methyltransferase domain-containing protein [Phycisphaerales bacterium]|nr:MAG: methyltransferase domain-containing protein [Phycisphaerales bacterium]